MDIFNKRINAVKDMLSSKQAALVTDEISIFYFTGFPHSEGYLMITPDNSYLLVDFRYIEAAQNTVKSSEVVIFSNPFETINNLISANNTEEILLEADKITVSAFRTMQKEIKAELTGDDKLSQFIKDLRIIKSADEIEKLKTAQNIAEKAYL